MTGIMTPAVRLHQPWFQNWKCLIVLYLLSNIHLVVLDNCLIALRHDLVLNQYWERPHFHHKVTFLHRILPGKRIGRGE